MKKNIIWNLKKKNREKIHAFSQVKNNGWKKPKWTESNKGWVKRYSRKRKGWRYRFLIYRRRYRARALRYGKWRRHMRVDKGIIKRPFFRKIKKKMLFLNRLFKFYHQYIRLYDDLLQYTYVKKIPAINWYQLKKYNNWCKPNNFIRNKVPARLYEKSFSLGIRKLLYQYSLRFFRKYYEKKHFLKTPQSLFFKSLEISLIKFSLIKNRNSINFFLPNQLLLSSQGLYELIRSRHIKKFLDIFTQSNLFNQIKKISFLYSKRYFQHIHKYRKIFTDFDIHKQKFPWWESLIFTQQTYKNRLSWSGQQIWFRKPSLLYTFKFYYRFKKPWEEKRHTLYSNFTYYVFNPEHKNVLKKPKRIKQLLNKIVLPFYGHIKPQQIKAIYKKKHFVKSKMITPSNLFLNNLEDRLDVLVYRLNLAPNIVWARRLIKAGLVFLQKNKLEISTNEYFQKKKLYPVKLNKAFDLYQPSLNDLRIKKFRFKTKPILKINFKTQPGDIIQCHPFSLYQRSNIRPELLNKPIPSYLLTKTKISLNTEWNHWYHYLITNKKYLLLYNSRKKGRWKINHKFAPYRFEWGNELFKETTSFFLFTPHRKDFFLNDRNSALFLNWVVQ